MKKEEEASPISKSKGRRNSGQKDKYESYGVDLPNEHEEEDEQEEEEEEEEEIYESCRKEECKVCDEDINKRSTLGKKKNPALEVPCEEM